MDAPDLNTAPDIFERLKRHGVEYWEVKRVALANLPQFPFAFAKHFGNRTIRQVLKQIETWKQFNERDFLFEADLKDAITKRIHLHEDTVWACIRDANFRIREWVLEWNFTPPGRVETPDGLRVNSGMIVKATNQVTGAVHSHEIPGDVGTAPRRLSDMCKEAYQALDLFDDLWLGAPGPLLVSKRRRPQGWPLYMRWVIPPIYDLLAPRYLSPAHYSEERDRDGGPVTRAALYSKELLSDMLEILKREHPQVFDGTTENDIKAAVQRHHSRKASQVRRRKE